MKKNKIFIKDNSYKDKSRLILSSKAETLEKLKPFASNFYLAKQMYFNVKEWKKEKNSILKKINIKFFSKKIIIRSSSRAEDTWITSNAGVFKSIPNIDYNNENKIIKAINIVINSYKTQKKDNEQILVQEFLSNIKISGVVFTCLLETGSPYYKFNFDDKKNSTSSVTSGNTNELRNILLSKKEKQYLKKIEPKLFNLLKSIIRIEKIINYNKLDIEFAINNKNKVYILQVRPITINHKIYKRNNSYINKNLQQNVFLFKNKFKKNKKLYGKKEIFANMSDWNPAEIIGSRPKPLSLSLYKYLITDEIWALQRSQFGYQDLKPCKLVSLFSGQPYVNVKASLNSFIPANLATKIKKKLANAYIDILSKNIHLHDKIEFEIAFTIWTPDFIKLATKRLKNYKITYDEILKIENALKKITCNAFLRLEKDVKPLDYLKKRRKEIISRRISNIEKILLLINDCKIYGALPFAHAARAGFISTILLKSFVNSGIISLERKNAFLSSIKTISGEFISDKNDYNKGKLNLKQLIEKYGHLRPGTYEIMNNAYWEEPEKYFSINKNFLNLKKNNFTFKGSEIKKINVFLSKIGSNIDAINLIKYFYDSIKLRELVKFEFTKNLSLCLDLIVKIRKSLKLSRIDLSYLDINDFFLIQKNKNKINDLKNTISNRQRNYILTKSIELPFLIKSKEDFYCFEKIKQQPNFITLNKVEANISFIDNSKKNHLRGKILVISEADPGYDWIFNFGIVGLITKYGGANSHMAIRAAEINLPAAIGVGDKLYEQLLTTNRIFLDCENKVISFIV